MLHANIFGPIVITAGHWVQRGTVMESGARVEIRRVEYEQTTGVAAGVAGLTLGRIAIFVTLAAIGSLTRAHYAGEAKEPGTPAAVEAPK